MEVKQGIQREYNPAHPNFKRWQLAREISDDRAEFIEKVLSSESFPRGLKILDLGAGEGSTSRLLSKNNFVVSVDNKSERIKKISVASSLLPLIADIENLPFKPGSFDLIILQDVIEHLKVDTGIKHILSSILKEEGKIYLSTPNKLSLLNLLSDPHWGLPFLSLFNRDQVKKYFLRAFRKSDYQRDDIAELFSLSQIFKLFNKDFNIKLQTKFSVSYLLNGGNGIIWSRFHIWLVKAASLPVFKRMLINMANDNAGILNKFFTPTFYIILKKK